jgi:hypothetical protein
VGSATAFSSLAPGGQRRCGRARDWLDYAALAIAALSLLVAFLFGFRNRSTAKRALALSERQEARRESCLALYLHESFAWRGSADGDRWRSTSLADERVRARRRGES